MTDVAGQVKPIYERLEGEPLLWYQRFTAFRLMDPPRTIAALFHAENSKKLEKTRKKPEPDGVWYAIAKQWQWEARAIAWDTYQIALQEETIAQERMNILKSRYALLQKRVQQLDRLAQKLIDYTNDEQKIWLPDVKAIGTGPTAERVDLVQFNDALFREIRAHFADIAAELGERVKTVKQEVTGKNGGPIETKHEPMHDLTEDDLQLVMQLATELRGKKEQDDHAS